MAVVQAPLGLPLFFWEQVQSVPILMLMMMSLQHDVFNSQHPNAIIDSFINFRSITIDITQHMSPC